MGDTRGDGTRRRNNREGEFALAPPLLTLVLPAGAAKPICPVGGGGGEGGSREDVLRLGRPVVEEEGKECC